MRTYYTLPNIEAVILSRELAKDFEIPKDENLGIVFNVKRILDKRVDEVIKVVKDEV
jgi:hypothetical protein